MDVQHAIDLINTGLEWFPGWDFYAYTDTWAPGSVIINIRYPSFETSPGASYHQPGTFTAGEVISVAFLNDDGLIYQLVKTVQKIMGHEWREALRYKADQMAPLHPHRYDGNRKWDRFGG